MIYAVGVDISIGFKKDVYYFYYKGVPFKYVPQYKNNETDDLVCEIPHGKTQPEIFELMTEFIAAFAFANNARAILQGGIVVQNPVKLIDARIRSSQKRSILVTEMMDEFYYISLLRKDEQVQLARLYQEAFSANNVYLKILFFWHCLVYPNSDEKKAVSYIDNLVNNLPKDLSYVQETINRFNSNKIFLSDQNKSVTIGEYVKDSIRHSIAHIVRKPGYGINLKLDSWDQVRHLHDIEDFLQVAARHRLENDYDMKASNDMQFFSYINEDDLKAKNVEVS
jgi:hypothetical protein